MKNSTSKKTFAEEVKGTVSEIIQQVKKLIREGNARRVIIEDAKGKVLFQSQLTVGVAGTTLLTAIAPIVSAISLFALMINDVKIIVERYPEDENPATGDKYEVEAEVIEIRDEDDEPDSEESAQTEKTVGKEEE
ncbi:MAG TPA: DUF4342 domain-containing protein [Fodinibius sp.]|nr:DUF4342 domain-containing protein [Fodinibius sp.]